MSRSSLSHLHALVHVVAGGCDTVEESVDIIADSHVNRLDWLILYGRPSSSSSSFYFSTFWNMHSHRLPDSPPPPPPMPTPLTKETPQCSLLSQLQTSQLLFQLQDARGLGLASKNPSLTTSRLIEHFCDPTAKVYSTQASVCVLLCNGGAPGVGAGRSNFLAVTLATGSV